MLMPKPRPRFAHELPVAAPALVATLQEGFLAETDLHARFAQGHFQVTYRKPARKFWSPCLHLEVVATDAGSRLKGMWGPHPDVWTVYSFAAVGLAFLMAVALMWGLSQMSLKHVPTAFYAVPLLLGVACSLYLSAFIGQRLARPQMDRLRTLLGALVAVDPELL